MLIEVSSFVQVPRMVAATGGTVVLRTRDDGTTAKTRFVSVPDFEAVRAAAEQVTTLFTLWDDTDPANPVLVPSGWTVRGYKIEVEWPRETERRSLICSHFGARRKAFNTTLGWVKDDLDAKEADPKHEPMPWNFQVARNRWNAQKDTIAPWWAANSKEAYASGIKDAITALDNWSASRRGRRAGRPVGFPRFASKRRGDRDRVKFTTGTMRLTDDRRHVTLPVIGTLRTKENTRYLQRRIAKGDARVLSMTLSLTPTGRLHVSVQYSARTAPVSAPVLPGTRAGVDRGLRVLATVADSEGRVTEFPNPRALKNALTKLRREQRRISRRLPDSRAGKQSKVKTARLHERVTNVRRTHQHRLTTWLVTTYGEIVIEDLDIVAMTQGLNRRFRRSVADASMGEIGRMLGYKAEATGTAIIHADRWFPSSQLHHGCACERLQPPTSRAGKPIKMSKELACTVTGELIDRDHNAALNLRDWPEYTPVTAQLEPRPRTTALPSVGGPDEPSKARLASARKTTKLVAAREEAKTLPGSRPSRPRREPRKGVPTLAGKHA